MLVNAGEAMPSGGRLTIKTRALNGDADGAPCDRIEIVIRDTGMGILPENIDKIFDPFFTSKDVGQGTGLGLAVSYGIIEGHRNDPRGKPAGRRNRLYDHSPPRRPNSVGQAVPDVFDYDAAARQRFPTGPAPVEKRFANYDVLMSHEL